MNTKFNNTIVETNGVRTIEGGGNGGNGAKLIFHYFRSNQTSYEFLDSNQNK